MKTNTLLMVMVAAFYVGCTKNDVSAELNDSQNNEETSIVVNDTLCKYQNVVLDTWDLRSIDHNDLIGRWTLITYGDLEACTFSTDPDNTDISWDLEFHDSAKVSGRAVGNSFWGEYKLRNDSIKFDVERTILMPPPHHEWGDDLLTDLHRKTDLVTIKHDTLIIYYSQSKKVMIFCKEEKSP